MVDDISVMPATPGKMIQVMLPAFAPTPQLPIGLVHVTSGGRHAPVPLPRGQHRHADFWHMLVTVSGRGTFLVGGAVVTADAPSLFLIAPGVDHCFARAPGDDLVYNEVTFQIRSASVRIRAGWTGLLVARFGSCVPTPAFASIPARLAERLSSTIDELARAAAEHHPDLASIAQGWIDHLLFLVRLHLAGIATGGPLDRLRAALDEGADLDLRACARLADLSPQHLCRAFARRFGLPPLRYRRRAALLRAASLLRADDRPLAAIAASAGFSDHRYFIRTFGAEFGLTPASYRRQCRQRVEGGVISGH